MASPESLPCSGEVTTTSDDLLPVSDGLGAVTTDNQSSQGDGFKGGSDRGIMVLTKHSLLQRDLQNPTEPTQALVHLLKMSAGTGVLAMPFAFHNAGLVGGLLGTGLVVLVYTHCVHLMVQCAHELCRRHNVASLDFAGLVQLAFEQGPKPIRRYTPHIRRAVQVFLVSMALSACSVYTVFVASNLAQVCGTWFGWDISMRLWVLAVWPLLLAPCLVRHLRFLTPFSLLATVLLFSAIAVVLGYVFAEPLPAVSSQPSFAAVTRLPIFFSTATFAVAGITVVMPLENSMARPERLLGCGGVMLTGMTLVGTLYAALGFFGYLKYGAEVQPSVALNLPADHTLAQATNLLLALAVCFSYPLALHCGVQFTWPALSAFLTARWPSLANSPAVAERSYRAALSTAITCVAAVVPQLGSLMSLSGALFTASTAFLLPPALELAVWWPKLSKVALIRDIVVVVFGLFVAVTGTVVSFQDIISNFS